MDCVQNTCFRSFMKVCKEWYLVFEVIDAIKKENYKCIEFLIGKHPALCNIILPEYGLAPIHVISGLENEKFATQVLEMVLNNGGNPNLYSADYMTPVLIATLWGRVEIVKLLIKKGGSLYISDSEGKNAFDYVKTCKNERMKLLFYQLCLNDVEGFDVSNLPCDNKAKTELPQTASPFSHLSQNQQFFKVFTNSVDEKLELTKGINNEKVYTSKLNQQLFSLMALHRKTCEIYETEEGCQRNNFGETSQKKLEVVENNDGQYCSHIKNSIEFYNNPPFQETESQIHENYYLGEKNIEKKSEKKFSSDLSKIKLSEEKKIKNKKCPDSGKRNEKNQFENKVPHKICNKEDSDCELSHKKAHQKSILPQSSSSSCSKNSFFSCEDRCSSDSSDQFCHTSFCEIYSDSKEAPNISNHHYGSHSKTINEYFQWEDLISEIDSSIEGLSLYNKLPSSNSDSFFLAPSIVEDKIIVDQEESAILFEKNIKPGSKCEENEEISTSSCQSTDSSICSKNSKETFSSCETIKIREKLEKLGVKYGPVTKTTKRVYLRLLHKINITKQNHPEEDTFEISEVLKSTLSFKYKPLLTKWAKLEENMIESFAKDKEWRGGLEKSFFNYLLLDPRLTQNLPFYTEIISEEEIWKIFLSAIFYIGKGKHSRPYAHLHEAKKLKGISSNTRKVKYINSIWSSGKGVVCLHVFHGIISAEAFTREAAMIDALSKGNLTNEKRGEYHGTTKKCNMKQKCQLGSLLLNRALKVYIAEGERQIFPIDLGI